jgi:hypothetical protein
MNDSRIYLMILLGLVISGILSGGCLGTIPKEMPENPKTAIPDPETGIAAWIMAVNDRDYGAVYDLMPLSKQAGISRSDFIRMNRESPSPFLASHPHITGYFIVDRKTDGLNATLFSGLQITRPSSASPGSPVNDTVFFTFEETYEDFGWKVWTR